MCKVRKIITLTLSRSPSPAATQIFFGSLAIGRGTDLKCGSTPIEPIKGIDYGINNGILQFVSVICLIDPSSL